MENRKARIEQMRREIERRGGRVGSSGRLPDDVEEQFLQSVLDCPCCQEKVESRDPFHMRGTGRDDS